VHPALLTAVATGVGSLPHRDADEAAEFSLRCAPDLPFVPTLPRRSPAEGMIAQAVVGLQGVSVGPYGAITVDAARLDPAAPVITDIDHDAYAGLRAFLTAARGRRGPIKWQFTGPLTLGLTLANAGVEPQRAFAVAGAAVQSHVRSLHAAIASALPDCPQVVVIDEPMADELTSRSFPLAPDEAIDLLSGSLASLEKLGADAPATGVHCCATPDWSSMIAAGPTLLSMPARPYALSVAGYISRFLRAGGWVMWGVIPTDGPLIDAPRLLWTHLSTLHEGLVQRGCDREELLTQAMYSPACGLGLHSESVTERVFALLSELADVARGHLATS
jgi:hypothetical protein